jgi:hypothetical protein
MKAWCVAVCAGVVIRPGPHVTWRLRSAGDTVLAVPGRVQAASRYDIDAPAGLPAISDAG